MSYGVAHICVFRGTRCPPTPFKAKNGRVVTVVPGERCSICNRKAKGYAMYPWGASPLCATCLDEECGT